MSKMSKILPLTRIGNPILRRVAKRLTPGEITSKPIQTLLADMRHTVRLTKYGVAIAAPQVGKSVALSVIDIKPTPNRPDLKPFDTVIINPEIVETYGKPKPMWEGCISCTMSDDSLFAQVPRYEKIRLRWQDETAAQHDEVLDGFVAHVAQHETDHLYGIMFVDKVEDTRSYMMAEEYRKRVINKKSTKAAQ